MNYHKLETTGLGDNGASRRTIDRSTNYQIFLPRINSLNRLKPLDPSFSIFIDITIGR